MNPTQIINKIARLTKRDNLYAEFQDDNDLVG